MKKYIVFAVICTIIACSLSACGSKKPKGTEAVTKEDGSTLAVVTNEDGDLSRNENGDVLVVATNENGEAIKDENGEAVTQIADLDTALVYGNRIEFNEYYLVIPDGWENSESYSDLVISKKGSSEVLKISVLDNADYNQQLSSTKSLLAAAKEKFPDSVLTDSSVEIAGEKCPYNAVFIPEGKNGKPGYLGYSFLESDQKLYIFMISADFDLGQNLDEVIEILNSVQYK